MGRGREKKREMFTHPGFALGGHTHTTRNGFRGALTGCCYSGTFMRRSRSWNRGSSRRGSAIGSTVNHGTNHSCC